MEAALLYSLHGQPDDDRVESKLDGDFPAVEAESTQYLDGQQLSYGQAAARVYDERQLPMPSTTGIETEQMETSRRAVVDWYADLDGGWAGISSSDGEWFVDEWLLTRHGLDAQEAEIDLEAWINDFVGEDDASVWGLTYSVTVGDDTTRAGANFHRDATLEQLERDAEDISGVGFRYNWDGTMRGVIYESGYVALYSEYTTEVFARWLADHVFPYCYNDVSVSAETTQTTLGSATGDSDTDQEGEADV